MKDDWETLEERENKLGVTCMAGGEGVLYEEIAVLISVKLVAVDDVVADWVTPWVVEVSE